MARFSETNDFPAKYSLAYNYSRSECGVLETDVGWLSKNLCNCGVAQSADIRSRTWGQLYKHNCIYLYIHVRGRDVVITQSGAHSLRLALLCMAVWRHVLPSYWHLAGFWDSHHVWQQIPWQGGTCPLSSSSQPTTSLYQSDSQALSISV